MTHTYTWTLRERENTMLVSFDIKFIRRDQKQRRNGEACRASPTCFWSSLITWYNRHVTVYLSCIITCKKMFLGGRRRKQMKNKRSFVRACWRANAFWRKSVTSFNQSRIIITAKVSMWPIVFRGRFLRHRLITFVQAQFYSDLARGYETFFILNPTEHEIFPAHNC